MLTRFDKGIPVDAKFVIFNEPGVNDICQGFTPATVLANLTAIVAGVRALRAVPIYTGMVPLSEHAAVGLGHCHSARGWRRRSIRLPAVGGFLFPGQFGGHLCLRRVGELASMVLPAPWTLHKLRHRFATVVYEVCRDLLIVQEMLGHASLATTQR